MSQLIILDQVVSSAAAGATRLKLSSADKVAMNMPFLKHNLSPREVSIVGVPDGLKGRDRKSGVELTTFGTQKWGWGLLSRGGHLGLGSTGGGGQVALKFPGGTATPSFTCVFVMNTGLNTATVTTGVRHLVRRYAADDTPVDDICLCSGAMNPNGGGIYAMKFNIGGAHLGSPYLNVDLPVANAWGAIVIDYNNDTGLLSASRDGVTWFTRAGTPLENPVGPSTDNIGVGDNIGDNLIGDFYYFGESLRTQVGDAAILPLMTALRADYGIA